jgi:hypothetical protein
MTVLLDHRETSNRYHGELVRQGNYRVILCKDSIQWILQRQKGGPGAAWRALGYCATHEALMRLWAGLKCNIPPKLTQLPDTVRGNRHG